MTVVDVDAHFEPASEWLDSFPDLKARMPRMLPDNDTRFEPDSTEMFAYFVTDDLLRQVPKDRRMPMSRLTTPAMEALFSDERDRWAIPAPTNTSRC